MYRPNDCSNTVGFCNREDVRAARSEKESRTHECQERGQERASYCDGQLETNSPWDSIMDEYLRK